MTSVLEESSKRSLSKSDTYKLAKTRQNPTPLQQRYLMSFEELDHLTKICPGYKDEHVLRAEDSRTNTMTVKMLQKEMNEAMAQCLERKDSIFIEVRTEALARLRNCMDTLYMQDYIHDRPDHVFDVLCQYTSFIADNEEVISTEMTRLIANISCILLSLTTVEEEKGTSADMKTEEQKIMCYTREGVSVLIVQHLLPFLKRDYYLNLNMEATKQVINLLETLYGDGRSSTYVKTSNEMLRQVVIAGKTRLDTTKKKFPHANNNLPDQLLNSLSSTVDDVESYLKKVGSSP